MADPPPLTAWLHCFDCETILTRSQLTTALAHQRVKLVSHDADGACPLGIVAFTQMSSQVCDFIRRSSRDGVELVLVVTTGDEMARGSAWELLHAGASDVLAWDGLADPAGMIAERLQRWHAVNEILRAPLVRNNLVGRSRPWLAILRQIIEAARFTDASILLTGETGTGKELAARLIHALSAERSRRELVVVDCTTLMPELSGSELFGHERGAFTGAVAARDGAFAVADGGTLFLDEVGELPLGLQAQLLRVIQEKTHKRLGSNTWRTTDFRLVCATNRDLLQEETQGRFRRDLYYRIATWTFKLPPLRERVEDILPLARHFLRQLRPDGDEIELDEPVQEYLLSRDYLGNVRDLKGLVTRMAHRCVGSRRVTVGAIPVDDRPLRPPDGEPWRDTAFEQSVRRAMLAGAGLRDIRRAAEDAAIRVAMGDEDGNLQRAAKRLGVTDRALQLRRAEERQRAGVDIAS